MLRLGRYAMPGAAAVVAHLSLPRRRPRCEAAGAPVAAAAEPLPVGAKVEGKAVATGHKLRAVLDASGSPDTEIRIRSSTLTRAKETAALMMPHLPDRTEHLGCDPNLNEGRPAQRCALVTTLLLPAGGASVVVSFVRWHLHVGFERIYLYFDEAVDDPRSRATSRRARSAASRPRALLRPDARPPPPPPGAAAAAPAAAPPAVDVAAEKAFLLSAAAARFL
ncbi:hypothetical protein JL720_15381 [Aureococcus anophagefferens]|nr:hypothetical protein JL720_15381 [Aureococcus anophagefferens]